MGFVVSLIITAVGFILALAVHPSDTDSVNVNTIGWILVVVGLIAFFADLVMWSSWGPGYRRRTYVEPGPGGNGAYSWHRGYPQRRVIEEEEHVPPQGPGY